jgi:hypothetical protein
VVGPYDGALLHLSQPHAVIVRPKRAHNLTLLVRVAVDRDLRWTGRRNHDWGD